MMWDQVNDALRQSLGGVLTSLAGFLPVLVAIIAAIVLAAFIGWLLSALTTRVLRWMRFDQRMERLGFETITEWSPARSPTLLVGRLVFWLVLLFGALVGLASLDQTLMPTFAARLIAYLPNVFVAVMLLLAGTTLARFLARGMLISAVNSQLQSPKLLSMGVKWLVLVLTAAMALNHLSIGGSILTLAFAILFGGIVLALALAVGLGSKDVVSRSWERQGEKREPSEPPVHHI